MALRAAAATSTMASEGTGTAAEDAGVRKEAGELTEVNVTGVRESQIRAIELKRLAPNIQDSISAESIGQLPDVTITDSLQRITGVQINRDAGVGTSVDVRGLPQVGTMMNGEVFISPDQRSEEHTSELQSPDHLVCRLLLEKKKNTTNPAHLNRSVHDSRAEIHGGFAVRLRR